MIVIEKNRGQKIGFLLSENKITFDDDLTVNLAKREQDNENHLDICRDKLGNLVLGVIPGLAEEYVAQLDIPPRCYEYIPDGLDDEGSPRQRQQAIPFNPDRVTLTLWAVEV